MILTEGNEVIREENIPGTIHYQKYHVE